MAALRVAYGGRQVAERFWEIDFLRGIAVILMIAFHAAFDLNYFTILSLEFGSLFWFWFPRSIAATFIFLVGLSLTISNSRLPKTSPKKFLKRGAKIFLLGLAITAITWLFFPREFILFGILHFIGISIILAMPFLEWKQKTLALAIPLIAAGALLQTVHFPFPWLLWLGAAPAGFHTFDYFPLLPWFGFVLLGIFAGNTLYPTGRRAFRAIELGQKPPITQLAWLGRHSLLIYFLHQPILMAAILLLA